ncbi:MAG: MarR family transcriptional regulator [Candidatus Omnitrophica bacterium]|nr:MarR family transcriptional regulator [Candidatus Omnitrophota bacterium]
MTELTLSEFVDKLDEAMWVLMKEFSRRQMRELLKEKLTLSQFLILNFLHKERECKMSYLSRFMQVSMPAMTGVVERLVRQGFVRRDIDPKDRRIVKVKLTPKGEVLLKRINSQRHKTIKEIFSKISSSDRKEYLRILTQLKDRLLEEKR